MRCHKIKFPSDRQCRFCALTGFTLIEVLVTVSLIALIGLALYSSLASGIRVMQRVTEPVSEENVTIFLEKISRELENAFLYKSFPFEGFAQKLSFATTIHTLPALGGDYGIGRVTYDYDSSRKRLMKREENLSQIFEEKEPKAEELFHHMTSLRFRYFGYEPSESKYVWKEEWDPELEKQANPRGVRIEFDYQDDHHVEQFVAKTIQIPVSE